MSVKRFHEAMTIHWTSPRLWELPVSETRKFSVKIFHEATTVHWTSPRHWELAVSETEALPGLLEGWENSNQLDALSNKV